MIEWWSSLSIVSQVFACIAVPATVVLLIQTISMFLGMDGDGNAFDGVSHGMSDADIGADVDMDADFDADASDGIFGHGDDLGVDPDVAGLDGLRIFTVRGIIAFLVVFGWLGLALQSSGAKLWLSASVAAVGGFAAAFVPAIGIILIIIGTLLFLAVICVIAAYMLGATTIFYEMVTGRLRPAGESIHAPENPQI